jgi:large subunit ribosomal protein L19
MDKEKKESKTQGKADSQKAKAGKTTKREIKAKVDEHLPLPVLKAGNEIKVYYRVIEGGKERIQVYEGTVIAIKNTGISKTITVRKNSYGIAVERIFPIHSKLIQKIEIKKHTKVRRAKLYYLRELKGKLSRLKELRQ